jgi:tRNA threonylcarbamoyladenosine biosynthesis protein TsaB
MELSIDTASELASIALSRDGAVLAERSWYCKRNHTQELLPAIDRLMNEAGCAKANLSAVFVSTGPGIYTGLRVGVSVAKGVARALELPMVGIGRLALDAYPHRGFAGEVVAIHRAGRGDLAWAAYRGDPQREAVAPTLSKPDEMAGAISEATLFVGEVDETLRETLQRELGALASFAAESEVGRAASLAALGHARLAAGQAEDPALLRPVYLRPPAIGPQSAQGVH